MSEQTLVARWLGERRHLLVELVGLSRSLRNRAANTESLRVRLQMFCDRLVDYVSAGHFEVYANLATAPSSARLLQRQWRQLQHTTDLVLGFNERVGRKQIDRERMGSALAELSLALEDRFTIEDRMISATRDAERAGETASASASPVRVAASGVAGHRVAAAAGHTSHGERRPAARSSESPVRHFAAARRAARPTL